MLPRRRLAFLFPLSFLLFAAGPVVLMQNLCMCMCGRQVWPAAVRCDAPRLDVSQGPAHGPSPGFSLARHFWPLPPFPQPPAATTITTHAKRPPSALRTPRSCLLNTLSQLYLLCSRPPRCIPHSQSLMPCFTVSASRPTPPMPGHALGPPAQPTSP